MLSEQAKAALERWRVFSKICIESLEYKGTEHGIVMDEMLRLFPVKTLNNVVIRWDDKITPERIFHSGFLDLKVRFICESLEVHFTHGEVMFWRVGGYPLSHKLWPTNMGEVWQLMEKCGCPVGGGE